MIKNILYISGSILVFFTGMIIYGVILNIRVEPLDEILAKKGYKALNKTSIIINRNDFTLTLFEDTVKIKTYKAVFSKNKNRIKTSHNDLVTPLGDYEICRIDTSHKYNIFMQLNYPNKDDADFALRNNLINRKEYDDLLKAKQCPPDSTQIGGKIGIHGTGEFDFIFKNLPFIFNWTDGSVGLSNQGIEELYSVVKIGTPVKIVFY